MSNLNRFVEHFFEDLTLWEDVNNGHNYKSFIRGAIMSFLQHESPETAFDVYRAFFDAYRITLPGKSDPFVDLVDVLRNYEATAATLIDKQRDHFVHAVNVFLCREAKGKCAILFTPNDKLLAEMKPYFNNDLRKKLFVNKQL